MTLVKKDSLLKVAILLVVAALILGAAQLAPGVAAAADLDIYVDNVWAGAYTYTELEEDFDQHQYIYSSFNTFPEPKNYVAEGPALAEVLAPWLDGAETLTFWPSDYLVYGGVMTYTVQELIDDPRYSSFETGQVETILALKTASGTNSAKLDPKDRLRLMMGQRNEFEQTNVWMTKLINKIDISTVNPGSWLPLPNATPDPEEGPYASPLDVTLSQVDADVLNSANIGVKIYYTLDGTTPSAYNGVMFNKSVWTDNLAINVPITLSETKTIKAVVVGPGYYDSAVVPFTYEIVQ